VTLVRAFCVLKEAKTVFDTAFDAVRNWFQTFALSGADYFIVRAVPETGGKVYSARVPVEKASGVDNS